MAKDSSFCHVFLSFRGETRDKFTCFLHDALKADGFEAFMDKETIRVGDEVDSRIHNGIRGSMSAIVVFSENYASSTWCLDELLLILERRRNSSYFIIPIFYEVKPNHIRYQLGSYGAALEKHRMRHNEEKVEKWRQALVEVANILGEHVQGMQTKFIKNIVKLFREKLSLEFPHIRLPQPITPVSQDNPSLSTPFKNDEVLLYTSGKEDGPSSSAALRAIMVKNNVVFEERNCHKDPKYITELEELVGDGKIILPMIFVNGKNLCGEEEVDGLEGFEGIEIKRKLRHALSILDNYRKSNEISQEYMRTVMSIMNTSSAKNNSLRSNYLGKYKR